MIEPEEDKLYSELRRKLADYESPPPPAVWPGVQRHLAAHRRPRAAAWLLRPRNFLLVAVVLSLLTLLLVKGPLLSDNQADLLSRTKAVTVTHGPSFEGNVPIPQPTVPLATRPESVTKSSTAAEASASSSRGSHLPTPAPAAGAATVNTPTVQHQTHTSSRQATRAAVAIRRNLSDRPTAAQRVARHASTSIVTHQNLHSSALVASNTDLATDRITRSATLPLTSAAPILLLATLPARPILVNHPTLAQPQRVPETPRDSTLERGWVVQVLAGPALTYRTLGAAPAGSVSRLERLALAYGGQLQVGYSFSSRLLLTAGLGYAEYATRLKLQLQNDSAVQAVRSRDVYRFLQVPVQARYWVGQWGALRYGVVGGATLNVLLGGRTTEGAPCACEQQPITFTDSTTAYRRVGLSVHVGAQAAYRLNARWSLLMQPSFHYFLTPTALPSSNPTRRRPWGAALQAGVSLDLP